MTKNSEYGFKIAYVGRLDVPNEENKDKLLEQLMNNGYFIRELTRRQSLRCSTDLNKEVGEKEFTYYEIYERVK